MSYVPAQRSSEPILQSFNLRRARALGGGVLWRATEAGLDGNYLSVQITDDRFVVCRYNTHSSEAVTGAQTTFLRMNMQAVDAITIDSVSRLATLCHRNFATGELTPVSTLGYVSYGALSSLGSKAVVNLTQPAVPTTIIIALACDVYTPQVDEAGWDIPTLVAQLSNARIELCLPADVVGAPPLPSFLPTFGEVRLSGGAGLPRTPDEVYTGPTTAKAMLNYVEKPDGTVAVYAQLYTWVGTSNSNGQWVPDDEVPTFIGDSQLE